MMRAYHWVGAAMYELPIAASKMNRGRRQESVHDVADAGQTRKSGNAPRS
ncbi:hypothetical protein I549_4392 [Mycobacterium avium subsp. avium 2285 (R)]|nr:hypothetical protein I549_4392 [Mycobacterium avium subsp. avium 2285 (R)]